MTEPSKYRAALAKLIRKELGLSWTPIIIDEHYEGKSEVQIGDYTWDTVGGSLEIRFKSPVNDKAQTWSRELADEGDFAILMEELLEL